LAQSLCACEHCSVGTFVHWMDACSLDHNAGAALAGGDGRCLPAHADNMPAVQDGALVHLLRSPQVDGACWNEIKRYLEDDPKATRGWMQTQAMAGYYQAKVANEDTKTKHCLAMLQQDPEVKPILEDIQRHGFATALKYCQEEELMLLISRKMGGCPAELQPMMQKLETMPVSLHEACKAGDLAAVHVLLHKNDPIDTQDHKGITPLGYAIGADRVSIAKLLLEKRANPHSVDSLGNCGLHYAAGYGRKELFQLLLTAGVSANQANSQGQTPLNVAFLNNEDEMMAILQRQGCCFAPQHELASLGFLPA